MAHFKRLTTDASALEPVRLDDLAWFGRVSGFDDPARAERLIRAAREEIEAITGVIMRPGRFRVVMDAWTPVFELPLRPVRSVESLRWYSAIGDVTSIAPSSFVADLVAPLARVVVGRDVVRPYNMRPLAGVELEVEAGYERAEDVPEDIRQHIVTVALMRFEHRDDPDALERIARYAFRGAPGYGGDLA